MPAVIKTTGEYIPDWHSKGHTRVVQNIQNLAALVRYEVAYNRTLGLPADLVDLPAKELEARYAAELSELIEINEPRAIVREISNFSVTPGGDFVCEVVIDFAD